MSWALFNMEGFLFLLRWGHFLFGISWIGTLWYFNFAQGPFMNEVDAPVKSAVNAKARSRGPSKQRKVGGNLLSQEVSPQVPSALTSLTSGFGMGPGVPSSLKSPRDYFHIVIRQLN